MYTQCPACRTVYEIDEEVLQASLGVVRCGHCSQRFDALRTLSNTLPEGPDQVLPDHDPEITMPTLTGAVTQNDDGIPAITTRVHTPPPAGPEWTGSRPDGARSQPARDGGSGTSAQAAVAIADSAVEPAPLETPAETGTASPILTPSSTDDPQTSETAAPAPATSPTEAAPPDAEPILDLPAAYPDEPDADTTPPEDALALQPAAGVATGEGVPEGDAEQSAPEVPAYLLPRRPHRDHGEWRWLLGCAGLVLILVAQLAWAERTTLIRSPATRAWAVRLCARVDCHLPPIRDPQALALLARDIRPDPNVANALAITATVRNRAPFRQPWPIVVVELTDVDDDVVAMRRFRPDEYLQDPARLQAGIAPHTTAAIAFVVADPGKRANGFRFSFQ